MTRGPKPTPRNLRIIRGTDRASRMNDDEPIVPVSVPDPPEFLSDAEAEKFREVGALLARMRVMSDADADALAVYARNWCTWVDASNKVIEMGAIVRAPKTGVPMQNPYVSIANKAQDNWRRILTEFGLTPSSRTRVNSK